MAFLLYLQRRLLDQLADTPPTYPPVIVPRPVLDKGETFDFFLLDETPETAVIGAVPVVAHDEVGALGDLDRAEGIPGILFFRDDILFLVYLMGVLVELAVYVDLFIESLHRVTRERPLSV